MTIIKNNNPFETDRWEDEANHLFWLPPILFDKLERNRCTYLIGTRGAGKTTMLKALDSQEQLKNQSLRKQIEIVRGQPLFSNRYIGIYFDVSKDYVLDTFYANIRKENLTEDEIERERGRLFASYIEYLSIYYLIEAIEKIRDAGYLEYSIQDEQICIKNILRLRPEIREFIDSNEDVFLIEDIKYAIKGIYEKIWNDSENKKGKNYQIQLPSVQIGKILGELSKPLLKLCSSDAEQWILKTCIDSIESLDQAQITALNTLIATQREHTTYVFASTREDIDHESTFLQKHPLTADDRDIIYLDEFYSEKTNFEMFTKQVTWLRFEKLLGSSSFDVNLEKILGRYSINELLEYEINNTKNVAYKKFQTIVKNEFKEKWLELLKSVYSEKDYLNVKNGIYPPPYTQAYLTKKLRINLDQYRGNKNEFSLLQKEEFNKKVVSAMLCLCEDPEYGYPLTIPYAGYNMIIRMSDSNIRDFMRQMKQIYEFSQSKEEDFLNRQVTIEVQKKAISEASEAKYSEIAKSSSYGIQMKKFILILGELTHYLHSVEKNALKTSERGIYVIDYEKIPEMSERKKLFDIIYQASVNKYYLKIIVDKQQNVNGITKQKIRLHRLFAPRFHFSYRVGVNTGERYEFELNPNTLLHYICSQSDSESPQEIALMIAEKTAKNQRTLTQW